MYMLFNNGTNSLTLLSSELSDPLDRNRCQSHQKVAFFARKHIHIIEVTCDARISLLTIRQRAAGSRGQPWKSQSYLYDSRHDSGLDSSRIYTTPGTNRLTTRGSSDGLDMCGQSVGTLANTILHGKVEWGKCHNYNESQQYSGWTM